jgi:hypothetical protein
MMGRARKKESSVIFIGEEEDKTPLLQKEGWGSTNKKLATNKANLASSTKKKSFICGDKPFPKSFLHYLFSESSIIIRMLSSLCPPFGRFKRIAVDFEGSFLSSFLLTATVYWGFVNSKGESRLYSMGCASALTLGYLFIITLFTWIMSSCTKTIITFRYYCYICPMFFCLFGDFF